MSIKIVAAVGNNGVIGYKNGLPWGKPIPEDMKSFRELTMGKVVVMGRKTWESIGSKPLMGRESNIVLTRDRNFIADGATVLHDKLKVLTLACDKDVFIIGGAEILALFIPYARMMHLTIVHDDFPGDTFFPRYDESEWQIISEGGFPRTERGTSCSHALSIRVLKRKMPLT